MAVNFPNSPSDGDLFNGFVWDDTLGVWKKTPGAIGPTGPTGAAGPTGPTGPLGDVITTISETAPVSPVEGSIWYNSATGKTYFYYVDADSSQWIEFTTPGPTGPTGAQGGAPEVSATPPLNPNEGDVWFNSEDGKAYFYYVDIDSSQWVEFASAGAPGVDGVDGADGATGPTGPTGATGPTGPEQGIGKVIAVSMIFG